MCPITKYSEDFGWHKLTHPTYLFLVSLHDKTLTNCNYCMSNMKTQSAKNISKEYIYRTYTSLISYIQKNKRGKP